MTNEKAYSPVNYGCNGATVKFSFPWKILTEDDLIVQIKDSTGKITTLVRGKDYSVNFEAMGGDITTVKTYAKENAIIISRNVSNFQSKSFSTSPGFQASEIEKSFDNISCNLQEQDYNIENFKTTFSSQIENEIDNLEGTIQDNKQEVLTIQERFEDEVNAKIEAVNEAAGKIAEFEESIETAIEASNIATQKAQEATSAVVEIENKIVANDVKMADTLKQAQTAENNAIKALATTLNENQITNCVLEVPQNINLILNDGTLTLKAGSKVIVPNGANNFEHKSSTSDLSRATFGTQSGDNIYIELVVNSSTLVPAGLTWSTTSNTIVGTTAPSSGVFYDTANNKIYQYTSAGKQDRRCLPIALVKMQSGVVTEIKQVFNGLGHFGNCLFADKGIKGLIPNGRNEDGTLNNIEFETSKVITLIDDTGQTRENQDVILSATTLGIRSQLQYLEEENLLLNNVNGNIEKVCVAGKFSKTPTQYTELNPKQTFRAVDWFDFNNVQGQLDTTTANLNNRYLVEKSPKSLLPSWWEVYSDGLIRQGGIIKKGSSIGSGGQWDATVTLLKNYSDTNYQIFLAYGFTDTTGSAGQEFRYESKTVNSFGASLYNRNSNTSMGVNIEFNWETQGY